MSRDLDCNTVKAGRGRTGSGGGLVKPRAIVAVLAAPAPAEVEQMGGERERYTERDHAPRLADQGRSAVLDGEGGGHAIVAVLDVTKA